jgi:hypothetical protein
LPDDHPCATIAPHRDAFGNWCSRMMAPAGRLRLYGDGVVRDSGLPDVVAAFAPQHAVEGLPAGTITSFWAASKGKTDRLADIALEAFCRRPARLGARPGHLHYVHGNIAFHRSHSAVA